VETQLLGGVVGGEPDAGHDLGRGHEGGEHLAPARSPLFCDRKQRRRDRRAVMDAGARLPEVVHLEGMRQRAVGEGGQGRRDLDVGAHDRAGAAVAISLRIVDDDPAPGQGRAEDHDADRVDQGIARGCDDILRHFLIAEIDGELRECLAEGRHGVSGKAKKKEEKGRGRFRSPARRARSAAGF
jgi:hypothetical protein